MVPKHYRSDRDSFGSPGRMRGVEGSQPTRLDFTLEDEALG